MNASVRCSWSLTFWCCYAIYLWRLPRLIYAHIIVAFVHSWLWPVVCGLGTFSLTNSGLAVKRYRKREKKRPEFLPKEKYEKITAIINLFYIRSWCVCCVCRWLPHAHFSCAYFVLFGSFFAFCTFLRAIASIVMEFSVQDKPHTHLFNSLVAFRNVQLYWNKYTRRVLWIKCNYTR